MSTFLTDLGSSDAFMLGLLFGAVALVVGLLAAALRYRSTPVPIAGILLAAAASAALWLSFPVPIGVPLGTAAMLFGGFLGDRLWERILAVLPGAAIVIVFGELGRGVVMPLAIGIVAVAAGLVVDFGKSFQSSGVGPAFLAITMIGVIITVPDTERAMALMGAALPLVALGWPFRFASLGSGGAAVVALIGWVGALAWSARPGAMIGAIGSLGLMLAEPIGRRLSRNGQTALTHIATATPMGVPILILIHGLLVLAVSRIAGLREGLVSAAIIGAVILAVGVLLAAAPATGTGGPPGGGATEADPARITD